MQCWKLPLFFHFSLIGFCPAGVKDTYMESPPLSLAPERVLACATALTVHLGLCCGCPIRPRPPYPPFFLRCTPRDANTYLLRCFAGVRKMRRLRVGTCCSPLRRNRRGEERIHTWSLRFSIHPHKKAFRLRRIEALGARPQSLLGGERWNGARGGAPSFLRRDSLLLSFLFYARAARMRKARAL